MSLAPASARPQGGVDSRRRSVSETPTRRDRRLSEPALKSCGISVVTTVCALLRTPSMSTGLAVLVVDADADYGRALAVVLRRAGGRVRVVRTRAQALQAARHGRFDLAVVDLFLGGGGVELARELARHVPRLMLSLAARLERGEILEAALGFPVHRKAALARLLRPSGVKSSRATSRPRPSHRSDV